MKIENIKFKAKRLDNGEWIIGSFVVMKIPALSKTTIGIVAADGATLHEIDPSTVFKFTGLKDRNGVEVFENDIVKTVDWEEKICNIEYKNYGFCLCGKCFRDGIIPLFVAVDNCDIYVVGNKFDKEKVAYENANRIE